MNLFQIVLVIMAALIVAIWVGNLPSELAKLKNKKEESLVRDKMLPEDEKQKISDEEFITFLKGLKYMDKIYTTDQGTILNSKPHTFKDFVNNQKLPSKSELTWEILADNNFKISNIIKLIESGAPYPMDTKVGILMGCLKVTSQQMRMIKILNMYNDPIKIDDNYPLYIKFTDMKNYYDEKITVMYQAGDKYNDKNLDRGAPTKPTKY